MKERKKIRYLFKNIALLSISQFSTKLLSFLLVPMYTSILTTEQYGTYGLYTTTVNLLLPIVTLDISEAALRFALDKGKRETDVFSLSLFYMLIGNGIVALLSITNHVFGIIKVLDSYWYYLIIIFALSSLLNLLSYFVRGIECVKSLAISGVIGTIICLLLNILFLVKFKWGIEGYFWANILGWTVQIIYLSVDCKIWKFIHFKFNKKELRKEMLDYSIPLIGTRVAWWITDASDRYVVTWISGIAANGIYSVAYKIPSILNTIQTIFNQSWAISAVKEYDDEDGSDFFSEMYSMYAMLMIVFCSLILICNKVLAGLLYAREFYFAWKYVPFLLVSVVMGGMSGYLEGIFSAVKASKICFLSTMIGAGFNIILNVVLVIPYGPIGAAFATFVSSVIILIIRIIAIRKYIKLKMNLAELLISNILLIIQAFSFSYISDSFMLYFIQIILFISILIVYRKKIIKYIDTVARKIFRKMN